MKKILKLTLLTLCSFVVAILFRVLVQLEIIPASDFVKDFLSQITGVLFFILILEIGLFILSLLGMDVFHDGTLEPDKFGRRYGRLRWRKTIGVIYVSMIGLILFFVPQDILSADTAAINLTDIVLGIGFLGFSGVVALVFFVSMHCYGDKQLIIRNWRAKVTHYDWNRLVSVKDAKWSTEEWILMFEGNQRVKISTYHEGAAELIAYAEERLENA